MDKSLTPLIAVFALIILLSMILLNSNLSNQKKNREKIEVKQHELDIRPGASNSLILSKTGTVKKKAHASLINTSKAIATAKKHIAAARTKDAEELLRTILVFEPNNRETLSLLGGILYYSNRYREAEAIFRRQVKLDPKNSPVYNRLGSVLAKQKKYKEAIYNSSIAVGINPDFGSGHINLAGIYAVAGNKKKAVVHFKKAYKLIGYAILPFSFDEAFDNIREMPEFQSIIFKANQISQNNLDIQRMKPLQKKDTPRQIKQIINPEQPKSKRSN